MLSKAVTGQGARRAPVLTRSNHLVVPSLHTFTKVPLSTNTVLPALRETGPVLPVPFKALERPSPVIYAAKISPKVPEDYVVDKNLAQKALDIKQKHSEKSWWEILSELPMPEAGVKILVQIERTKEKEEEVSPRREALESVTIQKRRGGFGSEIAIKDIISAIYREKVFASRDVDCHKAMAEEQEIIRDFRAFLEGNKKLSLLPDGVDIIAKAIKESPRTLYFLVGYMHAAEKKPDFEYGIQYGQATKGVRSTGWDAMKKHGYGIDPQYAYSQAEALTKLASQSR